MSAIAFDIEAATAVEELAAGAVTGGPTAPIGDTGARRVLGSPLVVARARPRGVLLWGSLCHHVKREASRFIPSILSTAGLRTRLIQVPIWGRPGADSTAVRDAESQS